MIEERQQTIQTNEASVPAAAGPAPIRQIRAIETGQTVSRTSLDVDVSGAELSRRIVVLVFGLIQAVIVLRIVFLLLDAQMSNAIVFGILNLSQAFVAPFEGVLHTNALSAGGTVLDLAALVAIVGWTILEFLAFAIMNLFRREAALGSAS